MPQDRARYHNPVPVPRHPGTLLPPLPVPTHPCTRYRRVPCRSTQEVHQASYFLHIATELEHRPCQRFLSPSILATGLANDSCLLRSRYRAWPLSVALARPFRAWPLSVALARPFRADRAQAQRAHPRPAKARQRDGRRRWRGGPGSGTDRQRTRRVPRARASSKPTRSGSFPSKSKFR